MTDSIKALLAGALLAVMAPAQAQTVYYAHIDILGNVVAVTDKDRNVVERRVYEPYGLPQTDIPDGPGFTGHDHDGDTGLVYMQQRYYDPQVGRFLSVDSMAVDTADAFNFNRYNYAANNPYRYADPDGRHPVLVALVIRCVANTACRNGAIALAAGTAKAANDAVNATIKIMQSSNESQAGGADGTGAEADAASLPTGDEVKIDDKIRGQFDERGWSEDEVRGLTATEPTGTSTDNTHGRNDPATVYGTKDGGHVVINDKTGDVVQVSNKNNANWNPDSRIDWNEK